MMDTVCEWLKSTGGDAMWQLHATHDHNNISKSSEKKLGLL